MTRSILSVGDISREDLSVVLDRSEELKNLLKHGESVRALDGKVVGLLFEKPSTRTRTSFQTAILKLGGQPIYMAASELQLSRGEPIKDTARILGSYLDGIIARVYDHNTVTHLAEFSGVPVINGLSDVEHPTQILSDLLTIKEVKGTLKGRSIAFIGDGNNVANSLMLGAALSGMNISIACPRGYEPSNTIVSKAQGIAEINDSEVSITHSPSEAATDADILYTDVWVSMGEEKEREKKLKDFDGFQINSGLVSIAADDAMVMHCLPAHRGLEITDEVIEGEHSAIWQQGENKLYGAIGLLSYIYEGK